MMQATQASVRCYPLLASAVAHILAVVLIFSVAAPESARQVGHVFMPLFVPVPEPKHVIPESRPRATLPSVTRAAQPSALAPSISAPLPRPALPDPPTLPLSPAAKPHSPAEAPVIEAPPEIHRAQPVITGVFHSADTPMAVSPPSAKSAVQTGTFSATGGTANRSNASFNTPMPVPAGFAGPGVASRSNTATTDTSTGVFGESTTARTANSRSPGTNAAGFGSAVAAASPSPGQRGPAATRFESVVVKLAPAVSNVTEGTAGAYKPVEILQKPRPAYSEEARRLQLEGEVNLDVVFRNSGQVRVTRVLHGLGHGLDENAIQAASAIQFRPATVNGNPVDVAAVVRITFQLAY